MRIGLRASVNISDYERFYEDITVQAVADTVERLLKYPFGFHGDTGIRDFLYARLHVHGGQKLDIDDPRPGFSTLLLQSEHLTLVKYSNTGRTAQGARFDLALTLPPKSPDVLEDRFAENLEALFAFELGKNKPLGKVIDRETARHSADMVTGTSDVSKLYRELKHHGLRQGWAIEFYDSSMRGAAIIEETLGICETLGDIEADKKLVVVFVEYSRYGGRHHVSSNDPNVQTSLITALTRSHIDAGPELLSFSRAPALSDQGPGRETWSPSVSVEEVFGDCADFANRIIRVGGVEDCGRSSGYVNLSSQGKRNFAQLHPQGNGIALVLRSRAKDQPATMFAEIPLASLAGYKGTNKSWLDGTGATFERKGPAVAYLIPLEVDELGDDDVAWRRLAELLDHAKTSA